LCIVKIVNQIINANILSIFFQFYLIEQFVLDVEQAAKPPAKGRRPAAEGWAAVAEGQT